MTSTNLSPIPLAQRVADALRKIEAVEASYQSISLGQLVSQQAQKHGPKTAIDIFERGERATYEEMDQWSNKYANALLAFGIRKADRVGVMLPNRLEFPLLWFAIAKIGAVIVPINVRYTPREVEYVLADTQAKFAIIDESAWPTFSAMERWPQSLAGTGAIVVGQSSGAKTPTLDALLKGASEAPPETTITPDDLFSIQYTSGTTGFPKGCMLTHDYFSLFSYAGALRDYEPYERYLSASPFFYIDGQGLLLKSYRQGATLYVAPQLSSTRFMGWLKKYRIEWVQFPELIARQEPSADDASLCLKQIHQFGGWSRESILKFAERFPGVRSSGYYGMTEIGAGTQYVPGFEDVVKTGSLGMRAPFRQLRLVNEDGSDTCIGETGELWVSGRGIMKGYWNKPEVNKVQFHDEWFETGDLMRRDELGFYWLVGRTKDMIRRSSENIAAREVEAVIREIPQVAEVAALPVKDLKRGEEVKVFIELKEGVGPNDLPVEHILDHARARLAPFKVPRYVAFISAMPRTSTSNKVTKTSLITMEDPLAGVYDGEEKRWR